MTSRPTGVISVRDATKSFQQRHHKQPFVALEAVSLDISGGEFVSLVGMSGCGKTTLLRLLSGLSDCTGGEVWMRGQLVNGVPAGVGFVFQEPALLPWRTVFENVLLGFGSRRAGAAHHARVTEQLDLVGLGAFARYYPHQISGGMQQRAGLARALVAGSDVLFMDEPMSALDAFTRGRLQEEVVAILERLHATTVLVTHDVDEAIYMSDRICVMGTSPGRIVATLEVPLPRPRSRSAFARDSRIPALRDEIVRLATRTASGGAILAPPRTT